MKRRFFALTMVPFLALLSACDSPETVYFDATVTVAPRVTGRYETFYSDDYFNLDPREYHQELALVSHAMALSAFPVAEFKEDFSTQPNNLKAFWKQLGFQDTWCCQSYYEHTEIDSIGCAFSHKAITLEDGSECTVVAIAVRGSDYGAEWASNVTLGSEYDATGFNAACSSVFYDLVNYVTIRAIKGHVKFWLAGYSRAAITANMVAGALDQGALRNDNMFNEVDYGLSDVYAYCFEPPMGVGYDYETARSDTYRNIHNLINMNDVVPLVAPIDWKLTRYGVDHYYPDRLTDIYFDASSREKAVTRYHFTPNGTGLPDYTIDDWTFVDVGKEKAGEDDLPRAAVHPSQSRMVRELIHELAVTGFGSRAVYELLAQTALQRLFAILNDRDEKIRIDGLSFEGILKVFFEYNLINVLLTELLKSDTLGFVMDIEPFFYQVLCGPKASIEDVREFYLQCTGFLSGFCGGFKDRPDVLLQLMNIQNIMRIKLAHMPELSYAWLGSCDSRFYGDNANVLNDGTYYCFKIFDAESVSIFEKNLGRTVFEGKGDKLSSDVLSAYYFADGHTEVYLPKNGSYLYTLDGENAKADLYDVDPYLNETLVTENFVGSGELL